MKCLSCGSTEWTVVEEWSEAEVENVPVKVKAPMYRCNSCDQTSASAQQMLYLMNAWMKAYKSKRWAADMRVRSNTPQNV